VAGDRLRETPLACGASRLDGGENPAPGCVQLLVGGSGGTPGELVDTVARETGMRMAVDEPRNGGQAAAVQLVDVPVEPAELVHAPDSSHAAVLAEHVCVHLRVERTHLPGAAQGRFRPRRGHDLREIADQKLRHAAGP
jgi:hypothetical protein